MVGSKNQIVGKGRDRLYGQVATCPYFDEIQKKIKHHEKINHFSVIC